MAIRQRKRIQGASDNGPAIRDVAAHAGVSTATVSRTLSAPSLVRESTRLKVMSAVRELGYTPNAAARQLRAGKSMNVLVVLSGISNTFFSEIVRGIDSSLSQAGYGLIIGEMESSPAKEEQLIRLMLSGNLDGAVILTGAIPQSGGVSMKDANLPLVSICSDLNDPDIHCVVTDDRQVTFDAITKLVDLGHRNLMYVSGPTDNYNGKERLKGVEDAMTQHARADEITLLRHIGDYKTKSGVQAAEAFLQLPHARPSAVVCASDFMAAAFMKIILEAGVDVPKDVSVMGFDGINISRLAHPTLSTIAQPAFEMGFKGASILVDLMDRPSSADTDKRVIMKSEILIRDSVAPPGERRRE